MAFSPDGGLLAVGSDGGTVRIWDLVTGPTPEARAILRGHAGSVLAVAFSPDGGLLAAGSADATVRIWDVAAIATHTILEGHISAVHHLAFSQDGTLLATASADGTIRIWDIGEGVARVVLAEFGKEGYEHVSRRVQA